MLMGYFLVVGFVVSTLINNANANSYTVGYAVGENKARSIETGLCGENLTWILDEGILSISGTGNMTDFSELYTPWYDHRNSINTVVINDGVTSIGRYAFEAFRYLKKVAISSSVKSIKHAAFLGCSRLSNVTIPEGVLSIEYRAFDGCGLATVVIPASVSSIGVRVFDRCYNLESISVEEDNSYYKSIEGVLFNHDCSLLIQYPQGSINDTYTIPDGVTSIDSNAFKGCNNLASIYVEEGNSNFSSVDGVLFNHDRSILVQYPPGNTNETYTTPDGVKSISDGAFQYCSNLKSAVLSEGLELVGDYAFEGCSGLTNVTIPSSLTTIGVCSFISCKSLESFAVDEDNAFYSCIDGVLFNLDKSTLVQYPSGKGDSYTIPNKVTSIGKHAFQTSDIVNVTIPDSVSSVDEYAFWLCQKLTSVTIPGSVTHIGKCAFGDTEIKQVFIPDSVVSIDFCAFGYCLSLETVLFQGSNDLLVPDVFYGSKHLTTVCVPPDYNSTSFCGVNATRENSTCTKFASMFNHCFKCTYVDGVYTQEERKNATEVEHLTNECFEFKCSNESGMVIQSLCNSANDVVRRCINDHCSEETSLLEGKVTVEIEIKDGVDSSEYNSTEIKMYIESEFGLDTDDVIFALETDEFGHVIRICLYVDDEQKAKDLAEKMKEMNKGEGCDGGILCQIKTIEVKGIQLDISSSLNLYNLRMNSIFFFALLLGVFPF